jgi:hypothetical protein
VPPTIRVASLLPDPRPVIALLVIGRFVVMVSTAVVEVTVGEVAVQANCRSESCSVCPSARSAELICGTVPPAVLAVVSEQVSAWPYETPTKAVAIAASPKSLLLKFDIFSP